MKRLLAFILFVFLLVLAACSNEVEGNNVKPATLTDREELMTTFANTAFIFDYEVESDVSDIRVWAEKYEAGKLVDEHAVDLMTEASEANGSIVLSTIASDNEQKAQQLHVGIGDGSGSGSTVVGDEMPKEVMNMMSVWSDLGGARSFAVGEEVILATVAHSSDDTGISSVAGEFYEKETVDTEMLADYDLVYVYKMLVE